MNRIGSLDLVRGASAFVVAIAHYCVAMQIAPQAAEIASVLAVEVFFVLSGFVLAPQLRLCATERRWSITSTFLYRRWLRTIPPYLAALVCATIVFQGQITGDTLRYLGYVQNFAGQHNAVDYFPVAWSLSVEEWFYLVFPMVLWVGVRTPRRRAAIACAIVFVIGVCLLRVWFGNFSDWGPSVRRVVIFRIDAIAYGFLLHAAVERYRVLQRPTFPFACAAILLPLTIATIEQAVAGQVLSGHAFVLLAPAFGCSLVALGLALRHTVDRWKLGPLSEFLGRISYSVYLFHIIVVALMLPAAGTLAWGWHIGGYLVALVLIGAGFYYTFERPILEARPSYPTAP